jgi:hypothetical protein
MNISDTQIWPDPVTSVARLAFRIRIWPDPVLGRHVGSGFGKNTFQIHSRSVLFEDKTRTVYESLSYL